MDGASNAIYNFGNSVGYSVREVIDIARQVTGINIPIMEDARRSGDSAVLVASAEKIKQELGWQSIYDSIESMIDTAWNWHRKQ